MHSFTLPAPGANHMPFTMLWQAPGLHRRGEIHCSQKRNSNSNQRNRHVNRVSKHWAHSILNSKVLVCAHLHLPAACSAGLQSIGVRVTRSRGAIPALHLLAGWHWANKPFSEPQLLNVTHRDNPFQSSLRNKWTYVYNLAYCLAHSGCKTNVNCLSAGERMLEGFQARLSTDTPSSWMLVTELMLGLTNKHVYGCINFRFPASKVECWLPSFIFHHCRVVIPPGEIY